MRAPARGHFFTTAPRALFSSRQQPLRAFGYFFFSVAMKKCRAPAPFTSSST